MRSIHIPALLYLLVSCSTEPARPAYYTRSDSAVGCLLEQQYGIDSSQYIVTGITRYQLDFDSTGTAAVLLDSIHNIENRLATLPIRPAQDSNLISDGAKPNEQRYLDVMKSAYAFMKSKYDQRFYYSVETHVSGSTESWALLVDTADFSVRFIRLPKSQYYNSTY